MKRILITPGEPAGVGVDVTVKIAQENWDAELVVIADADLMRSRAQQLNLPLTLIPFDATQPKTRHQAGTLKILPVALAASCVAGKLNPANAAYVLETLSKASDLCAGNLADAIVTAPVHKGVMNDAGIAFTGHTEFFAQRLHAPQPIMLFVTPEAKVALATTHLPLAEVPRAITQEKLISLITLLDAELKKWFQIMNPHILVCGLNPHAGEQGHMGREEIEIIDPALQILRTRGMNLTGALPADTIFTEKFLQTADVILAMYHDQALPVVKYMGFGHAVNMTLGLPILRTSVDHGTALDVAGTRAADAGSLQAALRLAVELGRRPAACPQDSCNG